MIVPFNDKAPKIDPTGFIAPDAWVIGDVEIGADVAILFGAIVRGDILPIRIGARSNIQDQTIIHTQTGTVATTIGEETTIGHRAILHSATIGNRTLIGMGATVLDEAVIEDEVIVGAGCLIPPRVRIKSRSLVVGVPGKVVRTLTDEEIAYFKASAERYVQIGRVYKKSLSGSK